MCQRHMVSNLLGIESNHLFSKQESRFQSCVWHFAQPVLNETCVHCTLASVIGKENLQIKFVCGILLSSPCFPFLGYKIWKDQVFFFKKTKWPIFNTYNLSPKMVFWFHSMYATAYKTKKIKGSSANGMKKLFALSLR